MPYRKLFLSRWSALLWAAGVLRTAVEVAEAASSMVSQNTASVTENTSNGDPAIDHETAPPNTVLSTEQVEPSGAPERTRARGKRHRAT